MNFNDNGVMDPGIHEFDMQQFHDIFVHQFTTSERRQEIFNSFIDFLKNLMNGYNIQEVWIDGSFVTEKVNPNDVDLILFFEVEDYVKIRPLWEGFRHQDNIDPYCEIILNDHTKSKVSSKELSIITNQRNYWRGQFGFDRVDTPKGIVKLTNCKIKEYLTGGEPHVIGSN